MLVLYLAAREEEEWLPPGSKNGLRGVPMALPAGDLNADEALGGVITSWDGMRNPHNPTLLFCTTSGARLGV